MVHFSATFSKIYIYFPLNRRTCTGTGFRIAVPPECTSFSQYFFMLTASFYPLHSPCVIVSGWRRRRTSRVNTRARYFLSAGVSFFFERRKKRGDPRPETTETETPPTALEWRPLTSPLRRHRQPLTRTSNAQLSRDSRGIRSQPIPSDPLHSRARDTFVSIKQVLVISNIIFKIHNLR